MPVSANLPVTAGCELSYIDDDDGDWQHPFFSRARTVGRSRLSRQLLWLCLSGNFLPAASAVFTDPMVSSGTSVEVVREMCIEAHGLDLHSGFNTLKERIPDVVGKPSDLVLSHPPYTTW